MEKNLKVTDEEALSYLTDELHLSKTDCICKKCGNIIKWNGVDFYKSSKNQEKFGHLKALKIKNNRYYDGLSFMSERLYNGHSYHLSYCYKCACEMFPEIPEKKFPLNPATNRSKVLFQISDEDFSSITSNVCKRTQENYIKTFGEEEGLKKWNSYCQKQAETNTFEYKQKKYGWSEEQFKEYNESRAVTLLNLIKKHGEENGLRLWEKYKDRQRKTCTLEYFQKTYGETEGKKRWNEWDKIRKANFEFCIKSDKPTSKIADKFFSKIIPYFSNHKIWTNILESKEYHLGNYSLDFYDETANIVIEFYGDFWHCNPNKYKASDIVKFSETNIMSVEDVWQKNKIRQEYIEKKLGTKIFIVWQSDFVSNEVDCIKKLLEDITIYKEKTTDNEIFPLF